MNNIKISTIDEKINKLRKLTTEFLFIGYCSHTSCDMYKIKNIYTLYGSETFVLNPIEEGFEKSLDMAIELMVEAKRKYFKLIRDLRIAK